MDPYEWVLEGSIQDECVALWGLCRYGWCDEWDRSRWAGVERPAKRMWTMVEVAGPPGKLTFDGWVRLVQRGCQGGMPEAMQRGRLEDAVTRTCERLEASPWRGDTKVTPRLQGCN